MDAQVHDDKTFKDITYAEKLISGKEFNDCTFKRCDFSNSEFLRCKFVDCIFEGCNLSMMKLPATTMNNAVFKHCKMLGINFSPCIDFLFSVRFESCLLDYSSFMGKKLQKTHFIKTTLKEVTFSGANLSGSVFDDTDLNGAIFNQTDLSSGNFVTAYNYIIDPELNNVKRATFSANGILGLLAKYDVRIG
jgi:fluoroquinolone resistance protein